jgi:RNA polymerase primary sigma factor
LPAAIVATSPFKEELVVKHMEKDLQTLVVKGKSQGYLTYDDVNGYLPDQDVTPEKLDNLLIALDEMGIELVD